MLLNQLRRGLDNFDGQRTDHLTVAVNGELVGTGAGNGQIFDAQVDVRVTEARSGVPADHLMRDFRPHHRLTFQSAELDRQAVMTLDVKADLRKEPEERQRSAKITDNEAVEHDHEATLAGALFTHVVAQRGQEEFCHEFELKQSN
jgi:hypothetical protein